MRCGEHCCCCCSTSQSGTSGAPCNTQLTNSEMEAVEAIVMIEASDAKSELRRFSCIGQRQAPPRPFHLALGQFAKFSLGGRGKGRGGRFHFARERGTGRV